MEQLSDFVLQMQPFPIEVDHSMEALPPDSRIRQVYPEDLFENGKPDMRPMYNCEWVAHRSGPAFACQVPTPHSPTAE